VKEPNMFHNYETENITHKASDTAENLQLYRVVRFFRPKSSCYSLHVRRYMHRAWRSQAEEPNNSIYLQVFCRVTGFTSDFLPRKTSAVIRVVYDDFGWKNQTTRCNRFWRAGCSRLEYVDIRSVY